LPDDRTEKAVDAVGGVSLEAFDGVNVGVGRHR
jgi:hypothetical protein